MEHFEGLRAFKARLRPSSWASIFLSYPRPRGPWGRGGGRAMLDALTAFARGDLLRFGFEALLRRSEAAGA